MSSLSPSLSEDADAFSASHALYEGSSASCAAARPPVSPTRTSRAVSNSPGGSSAASSSRTTSTCVRRARYAPRR